MIRGLSVLGVVGRGRSEQKMKVDDVGVMGDVRGDAGSCEDMRKLLWVGEIA